MSKTIKRLTAATQARIKAVEKLDDFMAAIDEIVKDFEKKHKTKKDETYQAHNRTHR